LMRLAVGIFAPAVRFSPIKQPTLSQVVPLRIRVAI